LSGGLSHLIPGGSGDEEALLEDVENLLLSSDVGVEATERIVGHLQDRCSRRQLGDAQRLFEALREEMVALLEPVSQPLVLPVAGRPVPYVILMVGVNGVGKTTTIGKIAWRLKAEGFSVALAAADTFRAAAVEQLKSWGERNGIPVTAHSGGADPAAVAYEALETARARGTDVLIVDTAGRLHSQTHLMEQLKKVRRVITKIDPTAPHETLLVIDATTGQNAMTQTAEFHNAVGITGLVLAKMDGTAKGGIIFALAERFGIPVRFVGIGEQMEDLLVFNADAFVDVLLEQEAP
jgi:fused signal recognition particle receptor